MHLTDEEKRMLEGEEGEAVRLSMQILIRIGEVYGAQRLVPVRSVHAGCVYPVFSVAVEMMEKFADLGGKFRTVTTVNPTVNPINFDRWEKFSQPEEIRQAALRQIGAIRRMGVIPTWSCIPYFQGNVPHVGEFVSWVESSAIVFVNSVLGARTNRTTAGIDLAAPITGRIPEYGLLLDEGRAGNALARVEFQPETMFDFNNIGFIIGKAFNGKVPVIEGLPPWTTANQLKVMGAAQATRGGIALFHAVGITPEAMTRDKALHGKAPELEIGIKKRDIEAAIEEMNTFKGGKLDAVLVGCPHPTVDEVRELAGLLAGKKVRPDIQFALFISGDVIYWSRQMGYIQTIEAAGVKIFEGDCVLSYPVKAWGWKNVATDSTKYALVATLEVAPGQGIPIYEEIRMRIQQPVPVVVRA